MRPVRKDIELMAPAGSFESLIAAIQGGADSVYLGVEKLNMRARSSQNFTLKDLPHIVAVCREKGIQSYLTLNTVLFDRDIPRMKKVLYAVSEAGLSAVIASDHSVLAHARTLGIGVHISTQLNISNMEAVRFYASFADVIVLARELDLEQISSICQQIEKEEIRGPSGKLLRIELFVHGALCMAVSGRCYLSLHENNHSANRGECFQTCRKAYTLTEKESGYQLDIDNEYLLSPKDLNTIGFLDKILDAGVRVLKIEGRARSPEYVLTVTECYDEALRALTDGKYSSGKIKEWNRRLSEVFNRGFWEGYYLGHKMSDLSKRYGSQATKRKVFIGKGINYFTKIRVAEFKIEAGSLSVGDEILITGPTTGVIRTTVEEIRVDMKRVKRARKGDHCSIPVDTQIRRSDKLYRIVDARQVKQQ